MTLLNLRVSFCALGLIIFLVTLSCNKSGYAPVFCSSSQTTTGTICKSIPAVVQETGTWSGSSNTLTTNFGHNVTPGNTLIACIGADNVVTGVSSISGGGVTWVLAGQAIVLNQPRIFLYYGFNSTGNTNSVTVNFVGTDDVTFDVTEWNGFFPTSTVSAPAITSGNTTTVATGTVGTNSLNLIFACAVNDTFAVNAGSQTNGFTPLQGVATVGNMNVFASYLGTQVSGQYNTGWTVSNTTAEGWFTILVGFTP